MSQSSAQRPFFIGFMSIVIVLQAVVSVAMGIGFILTRNSDSVLGSADVTANQGLVMGIILVVVGIGLFFVGRSLGRGSRSARNLVAVTELITIAGTVYVIVTHSAGISTASGIGTILAALVVLYFLFGTGASQRFFASRA